MRSGSIATVSSVGARRTLARVLKLKDPRSRCTEEAAVFYAFSRTVADQATAGCTPNHHASAEKLAKASTVLVMMMRAMRPLSAP